MPSGSRSMVAPTWAIRSVTVRTRDGAERLDQVYRRLIADTSCDQPPLAPHAQSSAASPILSPSSGDDTCAPRSMPASRPNAKRQQTIDSQLSALRGWVNAQGHVLADAHVFRDEGFSGSRLDRPALDALRDAIRDSVVDVVAVFTPDRLARKYAYQVLLMEEFRRADCEVVFLHHPISDDPNDQLLLQIQGAIAEYERGRGSNQVTLETRKPLAGAALTGSRVTRKRHFSNHAGFRTKPTNDRNETIC